MERRDLLKSIAATTAVALVAPATLLHSEDTIPIAALMTPEMEELHRLLSNWELKYGNYPIPGSYDYKLLVLMAKMTCTLQRELTEVINNSRPININSPAIYQMIDKHVTRMLPYHFEVTVNVTT